MTAFPRLTAAPRSLTKTLGRLAGGAALCCALLSLPCQALAVNDDPVLKRMDTVLEENARLREEAWKSRRTGRDQQTDEALAASEDRVEKTRTEALAHVAGVSPAQVESLRKDGRSWGQAAGELGVHPGFLGVGKAPLYEPQSAKRKAAAEAAQAKAKRGKKPQDKTPDKQPEGKKQAVGKKSAKAVAKPVAKAVVKAPAKAAPKASAKTPAKDVKKAKKTGPKDS